jgi:hypothetical protein
MLHNATDRSLLAVLKRTAKNNTSDRTAGSHSLAAAGTRKPEPVLRRWYVAGIVCTAFGFCLVFLQYCVSEALYGRSFQLAA